MPDKKGGGVHRWLSGLSQRTKWERSWGVEAGRVAAGELLVGLFAEWPDIELPAGLSSSSASSARKRSKKERGRGVSAGVDSPAPAPCQTQPWSAVSVMRPAWALVPVKRNQPAAAVNISTNRRSMMRGGFVIWGKS